MKSGALVGILERVECCNIGRQLLVRRASLLPGRFERGSNFKKKRIAE
jgi:hypothetical protein